MNRVVASMAALALAGGMLGGCGQEPTTGPGHATAPRESTQPDGNRLDSSGPGSAQVGRVIGVTVRGGQLSGDTGRVRVPLNTPVTIEVTSDVADELHVHGYDREARIPAGGTGRVSFPADIPGVFEVELHGSERQLLSLQVS